MEIEEDSGGDEEDEDDPLDQDAFLAMNEWAPHLGTGLESDHAQHGFPRIASTRNNLTALSQRYNVRSLVRCEDDRCADLSSRYSFILRPTKTEFTSIDHTGPAPRSCPPPTIILHPPPSKWAE